MATVVHPVFPDQKKVVPDDEVKDWTDSGWTKAKQADALPENTNLTSFEEALLEEDEGEQPVDTSQSFQPNLDVKEA